MRRSRIPVAQPIGAIGLTLLVAVISGLSGYDSACAQSDPNERPLSAMQYFAVHNAFQRSIPEELVWIEGITNVIDLREQVDQYNVWHMELDVYWRVFSTWPFELDPEDQYLEVGHTCIDDRGRGPLSTYLQQLSGSRRAAESFFVVTLQLTRNNDEGSVSCVPTLSGYSREGEPNDEVLMQRLNNEILSHFPVSSLYTKADFVADGRVWPTPQELIGRGKHVAFWVNVSPPAGSIFLNSSALNQVSNGFQKTETASENLDGPSGTWDPTNRAIYRYPEDFSEDPNEWETAMSNCVRPSAPPFSGEEDACITFVGTTIMVDHMNDNRFHPPLPMYVSAASGSTGRGTFREPFRSSASGSAVAAAVDRVSAFENLTGKKSMISVKIDAGTYDVSSSVGTIDEAMTLTRNPSSSGVVILE